MNKMYLVLGDPSDDGHGKHKDVLLESNMTVDVVQQAYKDSCKLTGIEFNHNEDYTELKRGWEERMDYAVAVEYESCVVTQKVRSILEKFGFTEKILSDQESYNDELFLSVETFVELWIWFVKLSNPKLELKICNKNVGIPKINAVKGLDVHFGYGLF